jgi:hypothetical protein
MALQFTRNATVYVVGGGAVWQLSVLDGFSFTQSINSSEITINEAGSTSRRARLLFNDSLAPVEWSMSTYARPFKSSGSVRAPEEALWAMMLGATNYSSGTFRSSSFTEVTGVNVHTAGLQPKGPIYEITTAGTGVNWEAIGASAATVGTKFIYNGVAIAGADGVVTETDEINLITTDASNGTPSDAFEDDRNVFNLSKSNVSSFSDGWDIYVAFEDGTNKQYYKLADSVVNSASIDFDIDGIATIAWSGFAKTLTDAGTSPPSAITSPTPITGGLTDTDNFIRNRISTVRLINTSDSDAYTVVLTGGSFTIENNVNYLTPEELGVVNAPLANITGARSVSGSMTCYLDNDISNSKSGELFKDLVEDTTTIRNTHLLEINIGGSSIDTPRLQLTMPSAHLEIPTINVEDLLTLEVNFHGQVQGGDVDKTNESLIAYKA